MSRKRKGLKINKKQITLISVILIILLACIIQITLSRYAIKLGQIHNQESTAFYFESDIADVEEKTYNIDNWDGTSYNISFCVKNYIDSMRKADENITYTISTQITGNATATIKDSSDKEIEDTDILSISSSSFTEDTYTLNIEPTTNLNNEDIVEVKLTIASTMPYEKIMTANIILTVCEEENYVITLMESDNGEYVILNLQINNIGENISVEYNNAKLILDMSSEIVNRNNCYRRK